MTKEGEVMRIRVQSYGNGKSKSARILAKTLGVLRIKGNNSKFRDKKGDVVINWGKPKTILSNVTYLNPIDSVLKASNKLIAFETMDRAGLSLPRIYKELITPPDDIKLVARTVLHGHSGKGIVIGTREELYNNGIKAPLYTEYINKTAEYRVIVVNDKAIDVKIKKKKKEYKETHDRYVWNHSNGYVFARNVGNFNRNLPIVAIEAVKSLGLKYGAVDIIEDDNDLYVLEVNTAFGLEGTTVNLVANELKEVYNGL